MFIATLFTIGKTGKYPKCPSIEEWIKKMWYIYTITVDGDCSHEIKRCLVLGRKAMANLDSILKSRDITLPTKVHLVKAMVFPVAMYGCDSWTIRSDSDQSLSCEWITAPHESQHARPPCPSPTPGVHPDSRPSSQWCHPAISSSVIPFSSCPLSLPASESFPMSQLFAWGGQRTGVSALASFLPKNTQGWSPLEWTGCISLQSKGLSRVFSNTTVQKHQFLGAQPSSQSRFFYCGAGEDSWLKRDQTSKS